MRKQRIYLETTLFNFYFDINREAHSATVKLFEDIADGKFLAYTSVYVIEELEQTKGKKREKMISLLGRYPITIIPPDAEADRLADIYVKQGIIPLKYRTDGVHIAIAAINHLDAVVSMNYSHIVKNKTRVGTGAINTLEGYGIVEIFTPMEVVDIEES